jgi:hypothetical protein
VLVAAPLAVGFTQRIFDDAPTLSVQLDSNGTLARVRTPQGQPHGFHVGDRFRIARSSPAYSGGWTVCAVVDAHTFSYQMLHDPRGGDPGQPLLSIAVWYFSSGLAPGQNIFRGQPAAQEW